MKNGIKNKKILIALALCLVVVGIMAVPALAAAQKVELTPYSGQADPGTGFVVLNNSTGGAELTVSLKGAVADAEYTVLANVDSAGWISIGTMTTNGQGNANFHANVKDIPAGEYSVVIAINRDINWTRFWTVPAVTITIK